jgi:antitoxin ParD1/3/4
MVLTAHHETLIESLISTGRYQNASEVVREGLRLIEAHEAREAAKQKALQKAAQIGLADLDQGRHRELHDDEVGEYIADLGRLAGSRVRTAGP